MSSRRAAPKDARAARRVPHTPLSAPVLVDSGLLIALFDRLDKHHQIAADWLARSASPLFTVAPVLTETAFFLPARLRTALARLAANDVLRVHNPDRDGYARIVQLFDKYGDQDPDWADMELLWLAETSGVHRIATLDVADFSVYRINGRKRFEMALLGV